MTSPLLKSALLLTGMAALAVTFSCEQAMAGERTSVTSINANYRFPVDPKLDANPGGPFETLSDSVDYLRLPSDIQRTPEVDSLVAFYNNMTALNAVHADMYLNLRGLAEAKNKPSFDGSMVADKDFTELLHKLHEAYWMPLDPENSDAFWDNADPITKLIMSKNGTYIEPLIAKLDTVAIKRAADDSTYVPNIDKIFADMKAGKLTSQQLLDMTLKEPNFIPQTVLARQYALACYANETEQNSLEKATGLLQALLESGQYSPFLPDLWRMWRCRTQINLSASNDGPIQNHLYNAMRNKVAMTMLREYLMSGDTAALRNFILLGLEFNIVREGTLMGNYATAEDMNLFWEPLHEGDFDSIDPAEFSTEPVDSLAPPSN